MAIRLERFSISDVYSYCQENRRSRRIADVVLHHSGEDADTYQRYLTVTDMRERDISLGLMDIRYHFVCGYYDNDIDIWKARPIESPGAHIAHRNSDTVAVCWAGNFNIDDPAQYGYDGVIEMLAAILRGLELSEAHLLFHRDIIASTTCPGAHLTADTMRRDVASIMSRCVESSDDRKGMQVFIGGSDSDIGISTWEVNGRTACYIDEISSALGYEMRTDDYPDRVSLHRIDNHV